MSIESDIIKEFRGLACLDKHGYFDVGVEYPKNHLLKESDVDKSPLQYPETNYELDTKKIESFILSIIPRVREEAEKRHTGVGAVAFTKRQWDCVNTSLLTSQSKQLREIFGQDYDTVYRWSKYLGSMPGPALTPPQPHEGKGE